MKKILLLIFTCLILGDLFAQHSNFITGSVKDKKGEAIIGATIALEGTKNGTVTDALGAFKIHVEANKTYHLRISSIGYKSLTREVSIVQSDVRIDVIMQEENKQLEELVVVGYGVQRKRDLTGSISKIGGKELNDLPVPSFDAAIQGKAAGVQITTGSGVAGSASIVRVRGVSSVSAGGDPLYVLDGIPITQDFFISGNNGGMNNNPLAAINPEDIESIEILKDASANAIYGSRGANGVILITTKKAKAGSDWKFTASVNTGVSMATALPKMLNTSQYLQMYQEAYENDGGVGRATLPGGITWDQALKTNTNWVDKTTQVGTKYGFNFSAAKSFKNLNTFANVSYLDNGSYLVGNNYRRVSSRINLDYKINKWVKVGTNISYSNGQNNRVNIAWSGGLGDAMSTALPIYPVMANDSQYYSGGANPIRTMNNLKWQTNENRIIGGANIQLTPVKDLIVSGNYSYDYMNISDDQWRSKILTGHNNIGESNRTKNIVNNYNYNITATYSKTLLNQHNFSVMAGHEYQQANTSSDNYFGVNIPDIFYKINNNYIDTVSHTRNLGTNWSFVSYFSRFMYNYRQKYYLQLVYRSDASSKFGANYRWATFPSISGGWVISEEEFMKSIKSISFMKLRAGYGSSGNANIPDAARFGTYAGASNSIYYNNYPTTYPYKLQNENLRWETSDNFDMGLEMGFFKDRLSFEFDYYDKRTRDCLMELTIPNSAGFGTYWNNVGGTRNYGYEFSLKSRNIIKAGFQWNTQFNIARNYNEITSIGVYSEDAVSGGTNDTRVVVGHPIGTNYLIRFSHVDAKTGLPVYLDKDGNETFKYDNNNRVPVGSILPKAVGGMTNTFRWKQWDLSVLMVFSYGSNIYESSQKRQSTLVTDWNMDERVFGRWRQPGDIAAYPRLTLNYQTYGLPDQWSNTTLWLKDGSYARLRNVSIGYNLPKAMAQKMHLNTCRVSFIATNILTWTKYDGLDPEVGRDSEGGSTGALNTARNMGSQNITYLTPPQEKTYNVMVQIEF